MFQTLIVILVVILLLLGGLGWYQHRALQQINGLLAAEQQLAGQKMTDVFNQVDQLQLTGDAKKELDKLQEKYSKKVRPQLGKIRTNGETLLKEARTTKLLSIQKDINSLNADLAKATTDLKQVQRDLERLRQQGRKHRQAIESIKERYQKFHQQLNEKSFEYGDSINQLNARLTDLEQQYDKFVELTNKGDQEAAQEILAELQPENDDFADQIKTIPQLYRPLATEFPSQLKELHDGYQTLTKKHYVFTESDLDQQVSRLQAKLEKTVDNLNHLQLEEVKQANHEMADQIDHLYAVMQKEIDAKPEALHLLQIMSRFTQHAQQQNNELAAELDQLSLSYTLNNHEMETTRELNEQIKAITKEFHEDQAAVENHTAIFSQVLARQRKNQKDLTEIEKNQEKINDEVAKLQTDKQRAQQMLQRYSVQIRAIHRQVDRLNLPGVAQDYLDDFFSVSDEIKKLSDELGEYKVNMDDVTKQLIIVESDLESLQGKTKDLRDSAELTERLQQYANRFSGNAKIEEAAKKSQDLFKQYNYTGSLETIAAALEEVEPGSFKRIENSYYHEIGEA